MRLKKNIGTPGRLLRLSLSLLCFALAYWKGSWIALSLALFVLFEALFSWCVVYHFLGKTSCKLDKD
jgi:hypothetical protein